MAAEIEFIYFDMGNVLVDFDHRICSDNVAQVTGVDEDSIHKVIFDSGLQEEYECGKISSQQFVKRFNDAANCNINQTVLLDAVSNIFTMNRSIVPVLTQLRFARIPIGILSNTCEAHWNFILKRSPLLRRFFDPQQCVLSFRVSSLKPNPEIYEHAQRAAGMEPEKIFFCDDLQRNVDGALAASFQSKLFTTSAQLLHDLGKCNVKINL